MLDIKRIRNDFDAVELALKKRGKDFHLKSFLPLDEKKRNLLQEVEELKNKQNTVSKQIPTLKKRRQRHNTNNGRNESSCRKNKSFGHFG